MTVEIIWIAEREGGGREREREGGREGERERETETERQRDRERDRETETHTHTHAHTHTHTHTHTHITNFTSDTAVFREITLLTLSLHGDKTVSQFICLSREDSNQVQRKDPQP